MVVFRKEVLQILGGLLRFRWNEETEFSVKVILSMIPAGVVGVAFNEEIEALFSQQVMLVGSMLIVTGLLLFLADRAKRTERTVSYGNALIIGIAQAIAILPGISRSGATISTSVLLGIDRERAARFSFLMVVPLIFGKMAKDVMDGQLLTTSIEAAPIALGALAAFVSGVLACHWMIALVKRSQLRYFSFYCLAVGALAIVLG